MGPTSGGYLTIRLLGPLEVWVADERIELGAGRQRALLAVLALNRNRVVSSEQLVAELWGEHPPQTASKGLQNLVVQLRRSLSPSLDGVLATQAPGYVLRIEDEAVDVVRFERLAREGGQLVESAPQRAAVQLQEALGLWNGGALEDFVYEPFAQSEIERLEELRLTALEDRIDAELALGHAAETIPDLRELVARYPERERAHGQLMLALYRTGRQTEALDVFRVLRTRLREELGLEPSAELRRLEKAILTQDPALGSAQRHPAPIRARRRRTLVAAGGAIALAVSAGGVMVASLTDATSEPIVAAHSLVKIDAMSNRVIAVVPVGRDPGQIALLQNYAIVTGQQDGTVSRVDRRTGEVTTSGRHDASGSLDAAGSEFAWIASERRDSVAAVEAETLDSHRQIAVPPSQTRQSLWVEIGADSLWTSEWSPPRVTRWRLRTEEPTRYPLDDAEYPLEVTYGLGAAWIALWSSNRLLRIDSRDGRASLIDVGVGPRDPAVGFGSVWVAMGPDGTVWRVDPRSGRPRAVVEVGLVPWGLAIGSDSVWVTNNCDGTVTRIDPETNEVVATIHTGFFPQWIAAADDEVWVGLSDIGSGAPGSGPNALALPGCA